MAEAWLSIIGIGEDGLAGLTGASRAALDAAEIVFGGPRHLALAQVGARGRAWPVPFDPAPVLALRGRAVAVLASGDPFHFGAGGSLAALLPPDAWRAYPAPSTFSLAAARLGWRLESVACLGLHAAPFARLHAVLAPAPGAHARAICLLRDGAAAGALAAWLAAQGFGAARLWVLEALGGPRERIRETRADAFALTDVAAPVAVALEAASIAPAAVAAAAPLRAGAERTAGAAVATPQAPGAAPAPQASGAAVAPQAQPATLAPQASGAAVPPQPPGVASAPQAQAPALAPQAQAAAPAPQASGAALAPQAQPATPPPQAQAAAPAPQAPYAAPAPQAPYAAPAPQAPYAAVAPQAPYAAVAPQPPGLGALSRASGLPDALFAHDGQITKRPVRALTLSALAPRAGETLWDIGAGSGSVAIEWLLAAPGGRAFGLEADPARAARARANAETFGVADRLTVIDARAPDGLAALPQPSAAFVGGGASQALLSALWPLLPPGARLVVNAVTLETEALLAAWSADKGGALLRVEIAEAAPLGAKRGWRPALPIVQWSVTR